MGRWSSCVDWWELSPLPFTTCFSTPEASAFALTLLLASAFPSLFNLGFYWFQDVITSRTQSRVGICWEASRHGRLQDGRPLNEVDVAAQHLVHSHVNTHTHKHTDFSVCQHIEEKRRVLRCFIERWYPHRHIDLCMSVCYSTRRGQREREGGKISTEEKKGKETSLSKWCIWLKRHRYVRFFLIFVVSICPPSSAPPPVAAPPFSSFTFPRALPPPSSSHTSPPPLPTHWPCWPNPDPTQTCWHLQHAWFFMGTSVM